VAVPSLFADNTNEYYLYRAERSSLLSGEQSAAYLYSQSADRTREDPEARAFIDSLWEKFREGRMLEVFNALCVPSGTGKTQLAFALPEENGISSPSLGSIPLRRYRNKIDMLQRRYKLDKLFAFNYFGYNKNSTKCSSWKPGEAPSYELMSSNPLRRSMVSIASNASPTRIESGPYSQFKNSN